MGSSSKAKSSKKKSSKIHSQPRKTKRMKRSRRSKSKKVARRHNTSFDDSMSSQSISPASNDSYSLYSDSDSMNSASFSSSSSKGTYRGKKKVSRVRSESKRTRKRARRRSSSSEDFYRTKKRKRSRKYADSKSRKKSQKNKSRRNVRNSSATSDSHDCSTCKEESGSISEESEVQKLFKSRESKRHKRESREERVGTEMRSHRSPSSSSYSRSRDQSYSGSRGDEIFVGKNKSRRLRSVIIFAEQAHEKEGIKSVKDSLKEEIVYDRDDYPSPRSNDSSIGGSKRDVNSCSPVASSDKSYKKNVEGQETCLSNVRVTEVTESRKKANDPKAHGSFLNEVEMNKYEEESRAYGSMLDDNLGADDLEAVLRQQALENLKKFRGDIQRNVKANTTNQLNNIDRDAQESLSSKAEVVQRVLSQQDNTNVIDHVKIVDRSTSTSSSMRGVSHPHKDISNRVNTVLGSAIAKQKAAHPPDGLALSVSSLKEEHMTRQAAVLKSESWNSGFGEKASSMNSSLNQEMILQSSPDKKLNEKRESERKILPKTTNSITTGITNNSEAGVNNTSGEQSTSQRQGSNEQQTESNNGAQFEQKTMSVMRGGEMVQVNYKVYIPKRAPALSRRQLKR